MWFGFGLLTALVAFYGSVVARRMSPGGRAQRPLGDACFVHAQRDNHGIVHGGRIGVEAPQGLDFRIRRERRADVWFKRIGIAVEIEVRDARFDDAVYIESDDAVLAKILAERADVRDALEEILAPRPGGSETRFVRCIGGRMWADVRAHHTTGLEAAADRLTQPLKSFAAVLRENPPDRGRTRDPFVARAVALLSISTASVAFAVVGLVGAVRMRLASLLDPLELLRWSIVPSLAALALFLAIVVLVLGRSSRAHLVLLEAALVGGLGFVVTGYTLAVEANAFDSAQPLTVIEAEDIRVERRRGRGRSYHYYVKTDDWRTAKRDRIEIEVDGRTFHELTDRGRARIFVDPGALGFPWVSRIEPVAHGE